MKHYQFFIMVLALFITIQANALLAPFTIEDLAKLSKYVIIGEVVDIKPIISDEQAKISENLYVFLYDVILTVENDLNNQYRNETIKFIVMSDRNLDSVSKSVEDPQKFQIGEQVLVFVADKEPNSIWGDNYYVAGTTLGKYVLVDGMAYGTMYPNGISETELISKVKQTLFPQSAANDEIIKKMSPLKQFKAGIQTKNINCEKSLELLVKSSSGIPVCVKPDTKEKLIERGWAKLV